MGFVRGWLLAFLFLPLILAGCSTSSREPEPDLTSVVNTVSREGLPRSPVLREFDFGSVLAHGQILDHVFMIANPTRRPIRLLKAEARTPCCSEIGPLPEWISPEGEAQVPITFKPGYQSGRKRVEFVVQTDSPERPIWRLVVNAALVSELEVTTLDGSDTVLPLGHGGSQSLQILCRRIGDDGRGSPISIAAASPLVARFSGPATERLFPDGHIEATRKIVVDLPRAAESGVRQADLEIHWPGGKTWRHPVLWRVEPLIEAIPSGLVATSSRERVEQEIVLQSRDRSFRVLGASSPLIAERFHPPAGSEQSHQIRLVLDPARATPEVGSDVIITTDHPDQPTITLSILVLPMTRGAEK